MRGVVTVATALALPLATDAGSPFPNRSEIAFVGLVTVLVTLVLQGLTLAPLVTRLGVGSEGDTAHDVALLRRRAAEAALEEVRNSAGAGDVPDPVHRAATAQYEGYLAAQAALTAARAGDGDESQDYTQELERVLRRATEVERNVVLDARRRGAVSADVADEVLQDVEARAVRELD
jgi:CPA1 family monovalent cation:H+ antiporter